MKHKLFNLVLLFSTIFCLFIPLHPVIASENANAEYEYTLTDLKILNPATGQQENTIPRGEFIVEVTVNNNFSDDADYLIVATYDWDGAKIATTYMYANIESGKSVTLGTLINNQGNSIAKIKAFMWTKSGIKPLAKSLEIINTQETVTRYGYIVEGAMPSGTFSADKWQIKILTESEGVVTYDVSDVKHNDVVKFLAENADAFGITATLDDKTTLIDETSINESKFLWEDSADTEKYNKSRLVIFTRNYKDEIIEIKKASEIFDSYFKPLAGEKYDFESKEINGIGVEDNLIVFDVSAKDVDDVTLMSGTNLIDKAAYEGYVYRDDDYKYRVMVVTGVEVSYDIEAGFAVVTRVATTTDSEGKVVAVVSYVQNEEEGSLTFDYGGNSKCSNEDDSLKLVMGDVFMYVADANGLVSRYTIIARVAKDNDTGNVTGFSVFDNFDINAEELGKDTEIVSGYIFNEKYYKMNGREIIYLDYEYDEIIAVPASAYKYTYNATGRRDKITVGDFLDDVDWKQEIVDDSDDVIGCLVSPILFRLIDGIVVDVYSVTANKQFDIINNASSSSGGSSSGSSSTEKSYTITYNADGGKLSNQKKSYKSSDADYTLPIPTKSGYKFMGWFEDKSADPATAEPVTKLASGSSGNRTYYAKWAKTYTINYVLHPKEYEKEEDPTIHGKLDGTQKETYCQHDEEYVLPTPTRDDGNEFLGWYEAQTFTGVKDTIIMSEEYKVISIPTDSEGNKTYHAVWCDMVDDADKIYYHVDAVMDSITELKEWGLLELSTESGVLAFFETALPEVLTWESQGVLVTEKLVREVFKSEVDTIRGTYLELRDTGRETELRDELLQISGIDTIVKIFGINIAFGTGDVEVLG